MKTRILLLALDESTDREKPLRAARLLEADTLLEIGTSQLGAYNDFPDAIRAAVDDAADRRRL